MSRRLFRVILLSVVIVVAVAALRGDLIPWLTGMAGKRPGPSTTATVVQAQERVRSVDPGMVPPGDGWTPTRWRNHVLHQYQLTPDRRFVRAARWLAAADGGAVGSIEHRDREWRFSVGTVQVALPDGADFEVLYGRLLALVSDKARRDGETLQGPPLSLRIDELLEGLGAISERDLRRDPRVAARAARITARLLLLRDDSLGIGDALAARALATLALAEAAGIDLPLERSLVAWELGYRVNARRIAQAHLAPQHPWRRHLERRAIEAEAGDGVLAVYLEAYQAAHRRQDLSAWREAARRARARGVGPLALAVTAYGLDSFGPGYSGMVLVPHLAIAAAGGDDDFDLEFLLSPPERVEEINFDNRVAALRTLIGLLKEMYPQFALNWSDPPVESLEAALNVGGEGWVAGRALRNAVLGTTFYSALHRRARFYVKRQSNYADAEQLIEGLADQPGPYAATIADLYRHLIAARRNEPQEWQRLMWTLDRLPLGPQPTWDLFNRALDRMSWREGVRERAFRRFGGFDATILDRMHAAVRTEGPDYPRPLDARPYDRDRLLGHAESTLYRPLLAERLRKEVLALIGPLSMPRTAIVTARREGDVDTLRAFAADRRLSPVWRGEALQALAASGYADEAGRGFEALVASDPGDWDVLEEWIELLRKSGDHGRIREIAHDWYENYAGRRGTRFDQLDALIAEARAALAEGDLDTAVARANEVYGFMGAAREYRLVIDILEAAGQAGTARDVAEQLRQHYPYALSAALPLVRMDWCAGNPGAAAELLVAYQSDIGALQWRDDLSDLLIECLADQPDGLAAAARALIGQRFSPYDLMFVAERLRDEDHPEAAHAFAAQLSSDNRIHQVYYDVRAAGYLLNARGSRSAVHWLVQRVPPPLRARASQPIYRYGAHEFLWQVVPEPRRQPYRDGIWLMRAASVAVGRTSDGEHIRQAQAYFRRQPETDYARMGQMVLGQTTAGTEARRPMSAQRIVETTYYLGVRAVSEGRSRDAVAWFVACMAAGDRVRGQIEYRWARDIVSRVTADAALERKYRKFGADYLMPWGPGMSGRSS